MASANIAEPGTVNPGMNQELIKDSDIQNLKKRIE
jgi:hypothetical protein